MPANEERNKIKIIITTTATFRKNNKCKINVAVHTILCWIAIFTCFEFHHMVYEG